MRGLPFFKPKNKPQFAGMNFSNDTSGGGGGSYTLPTATASRLGGVKIGSGIDVSDDGTISASGGGGGSLPNYSTSEFDTGRKWIDGKTIYGLVLNFRYGKPTLTKDTWVSITQDSTTSFPASSVTAIINCVGMKDPDAQIGFINSLIAVISNNKLQIYNSGDSMGDVKNIYIEYTK